MMNRTSFEEEVQKITSTEASYKEDPKVLLKNYKHRFGQQPSTYFHVFREKCNIFPDLPFEDHFKSPQIAFNRNDRFCEIPLHFHGFIEINYVYTGRCTAMINGKTIEMAQGDMCIMDRNVIHTLLPTQEKDVVLNILMTSEFFSYSFLNSFMVDGPVSKFLFDAITENNEHDRYLMFHTEHNHKVKEIVEDMILEYLEPGTFCESILRFNLGLMYIELARCYQEFMEDYHERNNRSYMTKIIEYIEKNCATCNLNDTALRFNYSPNYLSNLLKQETGMNFQELLTESRMKKIVYLLKTTNIPIHVIAMDYGYQNQSFFRRKFKEKFGMGPREYRFL